MDKSEKKPAGSLKEDVTVNKKGRKSSHTGRTPRQIMTKHMLDRNDVITEDDLNNLDISIHTSNDTAHPVLDIPDDKERPKDEAKDHAVITPWDVIN